MRFFNSEKSIMRFLMLFTIPLFVFYFTNGLLCNQLQAPEFSIKLFVLLICAIAIDILWGVSVFVFWAYMFYHWGIHDFANKKYKILWFLVMSLGIFVGSWFYFIIVYELKKTIKKSE